jgi:hypothetical protein
MALKARIAAIAGGIWEDLPVDDVSAATRVSQDRARSTLDAIAL